MTYFSRGDLTTQLHRSMLVNQTKLNVEEYSMEISSGRKANLRKEVAGNFTPLASIERTLRTLESYKRGTDEADFVTSTMQNVLGVVSDQIDATAAPLLTASSASNQHTIAITSETTRAALDTVISSLNTRAAGSALFSGSATQSKPLEDAQTMMDSISAAISGMASASDIVTAVDDWFAAGTGSFETVMYNGATTSMSGFMLNDHEKATIDIKATNDEFKQTLKGLVLGSLVNEGALPGDLEEQSELMKIAGESLFQASADVEFLAAKVGAQQAKIEAAVTSNTAEKYAAERAKNEIVAADIYESAAMLSEAETQLQMMYTITARLSQLKLSDYI